MKVFRSIEDVDRANLSESLREVVRGMSATLIDVSEPMHPSQRSILPPFHIFPLSLPILFTRIYSLFKSILILCG